MNGFISRGSADSPSIRSYFDGWLCPATLSLVVDTLMEVFMSDLLEQQSALQEFYGAPVSVYTRSQAIDDGYLIDLSETARGLGFKVPVAITSDAFVRCVHLERDEAEMLGESESQRVSRLLRVLLFKIRNTMNGSEDRCTFELAFQALKGGQSVEERAMIEATIGPGDDAEPVITIKHLKA